MKNILFFLTLAFTALSILACGNDNTVPICNCELDEMCVDDECKAIPDDFEPAPEPEQ